MKTSVWPDAGGRNSGTAPSGPAAKTSTTKATEPLPIPNPNDNLYFARRDIPDATSPTGLRYKFTGYLVFDYFITDENGDAIVSFETDSSYHVLWKTSQWTRTAQNPYIRC